MLIEYVTPGSLHYANAAGTVIHCKVKFEQFDEPLPFAATANDPEPHGREIWQRAVNGEFGAIAHFVPPPMEEAAVRSASIVANVLLKVQDGVLNGIETACGFSMAFAMGPGSYLLFFNESQPDTAYTCGLSASSGQINPVARDVDYIELLATENGVPTDPAEIHLQVVRVS